ncbi:MAG: 4Fe-4S dicluster domain-containing protein [Pirellulaceae bacterium]|nr:4Fe-4S dicluster domain-containing protein [Pirellulaceae bacterium]
MLKVLQARWQQGFRTVAYPDGPPPELPARFAGRPQIDSGKCQHDCEACVEVCPTQAVRKNGPSGELTLDTGRCLFCRDCEQACPPGAIVFTREFRLAASRREDLVVRADQVAAAVDIGDSLRRILGRSLRLRQVSAGGCNACEADTNVLNTVGWDLGRFGIQFVASPRHADGLLITGPVTENMRLALEKTYHAVPDPKIVIAVGACAISGGPYAGHPEAHDGAASTVPVDVFVPGCPPHPLTILQALLDTVRKSRT